MKVFFFLNIGDSIRMKALEMYRGEGSGPPGGDGGEGMTHETTGQCKHQTTRIHLGLSSRQGN